MVACTSSVQDKVMLEDIVLHLPFQDGMQELCIGQGQVRGSAPSFTCLQGSMTQSCPRVETYARPQEMARCTFLRVELKSSGSLVTSS